LDRFDPGTTSITAALGTIQEFDFPALLTKSLGANQFLGQTCSPLAPVAERIGGFLANF
jgi:hypothetical protein